MTPLERTRKTWAFEKVDRPLLQPLGAWSETLHRWRQEGLPEDWAKRNFFQEDPCGGTGVHLGTCGYSPFFPRFDRKVLEENLEYTVFRDEHGRVLKRARDQRDASIAQYVEFPLKHRRDWPELKARMDPSVGARYEALEEHARAAGGIGNHEAPILQNVCGPYRMLWHLMGDEGLAYMLYDDPKLIHEIMEQWLAMCIGGIDRVMASLDFNLLHILEDMCCNTGMMVSPRQFRELMMPYYKALVAHVRRYPSLVGIGVDTDGDVEQLVPLLLECGVQGVFPFEVQAGMDVVAFRRRYGSRLVIRGGIDKRALALGRDAIDHELERVLPPLVQGGGYIISLDHTAPPDISLENYLYFLERARAFK